MRPYDIRPVYETTLGGGSRRVTTGRQRRGAALICGLIFAVSGIVATLAQSFAYVARCFAGVRLPWYMDAAGGVGVAVLIVALGLVVRLDILRTGIAAVALPGGVAIACWILRPFGVGVPFFGGG